MRIRYVFKNLSISDYLLIRGIVRPNLSWKRFHPLKGQKRGGCDVLNFGLILKPSHCFLQLVSSDFWGVTAIMRGGLMPWADGMGNAVVCVGTVLTRSVGFISTGFLAISVLTTPSSDLANQKIHLFATRGRPVCSDLGSCFVAMVMTFRRYLSNHAPSHFPIIEPTSHTSQ